ncbi:AraC family transcriptional regulator [Pedobacter frigidisoli]|uniref:AraC family transcriptional regulator n=1 Tax=Pedobacter frigidisoli TaxID=2530455 RepID=A0A4V2MN16_9SPHI|nr:helix-turn-helix domain-containing protein [Pedobacter frigidisoli]TCD11030.1 AraC family transcriptional regulator [Pedobacter frigidisoli]
MRKHENSALNFESLSDLHRALGLPKPLHPLISLLNSDAQFKIAEYMPKSHVLKYFKISFKSELGGKLKYGQGHYDFDDGGLMFAAPNQVIGSSSETIDKSLYTLLIHPDFFLGFPLAQKITQYGFFSYSANEALHLSALEKTTILSVFKIIEEELNSRIDDFSQEVIISQIELLLNYSNRFYKRQFITRRGTNNGIIQKLESILNEHFSDEKILGKHIPTVQALAERMNVSASYLSDMLRSLTGQNTQQHIHYRMIEKAKEKLSTTNLSVSEVAYLLGFEYPQSFSKFFKAKTALSPQEFRRTFN